MLTAVHCETPSGTLNPIGLLGKLKKDLGVPLFYVDTVAGARRSARAHGRMERRPDARRFPEVPELPPEHEHGGRQRARVGNA